jgi:hypothetical protein
MIDYGEVYRSALAVYRDIQFTPEGKRLAELHKADVLRLERALQGHRMACDGDVMAPAPKA